MQRRRGKGDTETIEPDGETAQDGEAGQEQDGDAGQDSAAVMIREALAEAEKAKADKRSKVLTPVPVDMLGDAEDVPEEQWAEANLSVPEERDSAQVKIDEDVKSVYDAWVTAGKPGVRTTPRKRRAVAPEHGPAVRHMLGRAGRLHGVRVVLSPPAHDKDGREIIVFSARDRESKGRAPRTDIQAVREWAAAHDAALPEGDLGRFDISERGRIPVAIQQAYDAYQAEGAATAEYEAAQTEGDSEE